MTVIEVTEKVLTLMNRTDLKPVILNQGANEIPAQFLDTNKAARMLNWHPAYTFEQAMHRTIGWYQQLMDSETLKTQVKTRAA